MDDVAGETCSILAGDRCRFNRVADQRLKQRIGAGLVNRVELAVLQVLDPGREAITQ